VGVDLRRQGLVFNADEDDSLSHLRGLQTLMLGTWPDATNKLVGPVPSWLGKLSGSLSHLGLDSNQLSGPIDVVKELTALKYLGLGQNQISGPIDAVRGLTELTYLGLGANPKLNGTIDAVASLTKLTARYGTLYLGGGSFTGKVPAGPLNWSRVDVCQLGGNHFSCPLPPGVREHCGAACLEPCTGSSTDLSTNDCFAWQAYVRPSAYFANAIPAACQEADHFTDPCSCTGVITCDGGRIVGVDLHSRNLTFNANKHGSLSHLRGLQTLVLGASHHGGTNAMVGPMPSWLVKLTALTYLDLSRNELSGPIDAVKQLRALTHLSLNDNPKLNGPIDAVAGLTRLTTLNLNSDDFSGVVPKGPIDWSELDDCHLGGNHFSSPQPPGAKEPCGSTCPGT
jgi:hypothetical protein